MRLLALESSSEHLFFGVNNLKETERVSVMENVPLITSYRHPCLLCTVCSNTL